MSFDRPGGETPRTEQKMVFEEVADDESGIVFEEDPAEKMAKGVMELADKFQAAQKASAEGKGNRRGVEIARVLLAKAKYEQAAYNERQGRSKKGEADRLLQEWQTAQDALDSLNASDISVARQKALSRFDNPSMDADTIAQLRRHASR